VDDVTKVKYVGYAGGRLVQLVRTKQAYFVVVRILFCGGDSAANSRRVGNDRR
jgi:hypothetical protein